MTNTSSTEAEYIEFHSFLITLNEQTQSPVCAQMQIKGTRKEMAEHLLLF